MTSPSLAARAVRRTVLAGAGVAMVLGMAAPASASTPTSTPKPTTVTSYASYAAAKTGVSATTKAGVAGAGVAGHATKTATKRAVKAAAAVHAPATHDLMPRHITAHQVSIKPNATQLANAKRIVKQGQKLGLPARAWVIAVATSLQETKLHNYGNLGKHNDHDSQGLFQQRPSSGWGTPAQVTNPEHAATSFYKRLVHVHNWNRLPLTVAAQKVQVSAFGDRYAQWETLAANLVMATFNHGPLAAAPAAH